MGFAVFTTAGVSGPIAKAIRLWFGTMMGFGCTAIIRIVGPMTLLTPGFVRVMMIVFGLTSINGLGITNPVLIPMARRVGSRCGRLSKANRRRTSRRRTGTASTKPFHAADISK